MSTPPLTESERQKLAAALPDQLRETVCPQLQLTKLFMQCGPRARREFLQDVKHIEPQLFREIMEGTTT